jgi:hypothetical protein
MQDFSALKVELIAAAGRAQEGKAIANLCRILF